MSRSTEDRLPPDAPEAERGVLGCILLDGKNCLPEVLAKLKGKKTAFYDLRHQTIFSVLMEMNEAGEAVDGLMVKQRLKDKGMLEQVGGEAYLNALQDHVPSPANLPDYLTLLAEKWLMRAMVFTCTDLVASIYDCKQPVDELVNQVQTQILNLPRLEDAGGKPLVQYSERIQDRLDHYARGIGMITGLPTGFRYWDRMTGGLHTPQVIVIGGRPGTGKTSLAMNVAERVAMDGENPVGVISMEMSAEDLILRLACSRARVNFHKVRTGGATNEALAEVQKIMPSILAEKNCPIYVDDSSGLTIFDIRARLRQMHRKYGIRLAIVDYLQLATLSPEWRGNPVGGYGEVAKGIQAAGKELGIPIMLLSQLNREGEKRGTKPRMSDLRESGDIEGVADFIGILWGAPMKPEEETRLREAILADPMGNHELPMLMEVCKNRNGPSGTGIGFNFKRWCMRFEDMQYVTKEPGEE